MAWLHPVNIRARDLGDAWFQAVDETIANGRQWEVQRGSYEGQKRWELDWVQIHITHPHVNYPDCRIESLIPEMPPHLAHIPPPTSVEYVSDYLPYMMEDQPLKKNELYTYGQRIRPQMDRIIERYKKGFGSNQECIAVARPEDIDLPDPPCMRQLDTRIIARDGRKAGEPDQLHFFPYFRSWDLFAGFPSNMAAIALMQQWMAEQIGVLPGEIICTSKGLHIYDHFWDISKLRVK